MLEVEPPRQEAAEDSIVMYLSVLGAPSKCPWKTPFLFRGRNSSILTMKLTSFFGWNHKLRNIYFKCI